MQRSLFPRLILAALLPLVGSQCGGPVYAPDYTPIGDGIEFIGICVVLAVLVSALAGLVDESSNDSDAY